MPSGYVHSREPLQLLIIGEMSSEYECILRDFELNKTIGRIGTIWYWGNITPTLSTYQINFVQKRLLSGLDCNRMYYMILQLL